MNSVSPRPSQVALVLSPLAERAFQELFLGDRALKTAADRVLAHAIILTQTGGDALFIWNTLSWDPLCAPVAAIEALLEQLAPAEFRFIRIGEEPADMDVRGKRHGEPFFLGYQRRIMFFDQDETLRYLVGGGFVF